MKANSKTPNEQNKHKQINKKNNQNKHGLYKGSQTTQRLNLLLQHVKIKSPNIIAALHDHLVNGSAANVAAALNQVPEPNLTRALNSLKKHAEITEQIKEYDYYKKQT